MQNKFSNINASLIYRHRNPEGASWQIAAGVDRYGNLTGDHSWKYGAYNLSTYINQAFLKGYWKKTFGSHEVQAGVQAIGYMMDPGIMEPYGAESGIIKKVMPREYAVEPSLFLSDLITFSEQFYLISITDVIHRNSFIIQEDISAHQCIIHSERVYSV